MRKTFSILLTVAAIMVMIGCVPTFAESNNDAISVNWRETNPELASIFEKFAGGEVWQNNDTLTDTEKHMITIVSLVTQQSETLLSDAVQAALDAGVSPIEIQEAVYQCAPYCGYSRAVDASVIADAIFTANGIELPLEPQATVDENSRFKDGLDVQASIFGEGMRQAAAEPDQMPESSYYLVENCFGDHYTRGTLDTATREMLTLAVLVNLGTESQMSAHIMGNLSVGRTPNAISDIIYQCLPYAGYPRILNALNVFSSVQEMMMQQSQ